MNKNSLKTKGVINKAFLLLFIAVTFCGAAFGEATSVLTYTKTAAGANPEAGSITFTTYYNNDDSKIQTEDSWNDSVPSSNQGYVSNSGVSRVNPTQAAGDQSGQQYNIWISYDSIDGTQHQGGTSSILVNPPTSNGVPSSGTGYTSPGTSGSPLNLAASNYLAAPSGTTATPGNGEVFINWSQVTGATGYRVYRRPADSEGATEIVFTRAGIISSGSQLGFVDTGRTNGTTYNYIVIATDATKRSGHGLEVSATPTAAGVVPSISGPASGTAGQSVTITGSNFKAAQGTGNVYFNGVAASAITSWNDTSIDATIDINTPTGAGTLVVKNSDGLEDSAAFTVNAPNNTPNTPSTLGPAALVNGSLGNDNTPTFTFSQSDPDAANTVQFRIQIDDTAGFGSPVVDYTSALQAQGAASFTVGQALGGGSYTIGSVGQTLSDGNYYWRVLTTDNAGASSSYSTANGGAVAFVIDATAPSAPVSGNITVTQNAPGSADQVSGAAGAVEGNATVRVYSDAGLTNLIDSTTAAANGSFAAINIGDNTNGTVHIVAVDAAGNVSGATSKTNDIVAPSAPTTVLFSPVGGTMVSNTLNSTNTNFTATANITSGQATGGSAELLRGGVSFSPAIVDSPIAAGDAIVTFNAGLTTNAQVQSAFASGATLSVRLTDAAGNSSTSSVGNPTITVDYTAPTISIGAPSATLTKSGPITYTVSYSGADTVTLAAANVSLNTTGSATGAIAISGSGVASRTVTISSISGDGTIGISIAAGTASDNAGNSASSAGPSAIFTVDNTAPTAPTAVSFTPIGGTTVANTLNSTNTNFTATANITAGQATGGSAELLRGGVSFSPAIVDSSIAAGDAIATFNAGLTTNAQVQSAFASGATLSVRLTDAAGNSSTSSVGNPAITVDYTTPTMTFNPLTGATGVAIGQNVVITFNKAMNTGSLTYTVFPNPGGLSVAWSAGDTIATISHSSFAFGTLYTVTVTAATDVAGNSYSGANSTSFTTVAAANGSLQLSAATYTVVESVGTATITVTRTSGSDGTVGISYATSNGTATAGDDYTAASGTLSWGSGDTASKTFTIPITDDLLDESSETINIALSAPTGGASLGTPNTAVLTISDNDPTPTVAFATASSSGSEGNTPADLTVNLSAASGLTVTVNYAVTGGTATSGPDYTLASGTLTFTPGVTSQNVSATIVNDSANEADETIIVTLSSPANASLGATTTHTYTIVNDDAAVPGTLQLSAATYSVAESGPTATITVTRTVGSNGAVGISYATSNGTATAGSDYTAASGTLSWGDGDTASKTFTVAITNDSLDETNETVNIALSAPTGGAALGAQSTAVLTINDNDNSPNITGITWDITDGTPGDGINQNLLNQNHVYGTIIITGTDFGADPGAGNRSNATNNVAISGIMLSETTDVANNAGTQIYAWSNTSISVGVPRQNGSNFIVAGDLPVVVTAGGNVSNSNQTIDVRPMVYSLTPNSGTVGESVVIGGTAFGTAAGAINVVFNGTSSPATSPTNTSLNTTVPVGATTGALSVVVNGKVSNTNYDWGAQDPVTFTVTQPTVAFAAATSSGAESATPVNLAVNLSSASATTVTVDFSVTGGTATGGGTDYTLAAGTLTFNAGETTKNISASIVDDAIVEANETIIVTLAAPTNATLGAQTTHTYTINNNDTAPTMTFSPAAGATGVAVNQNVVITFSKAMTPASLTYSLLPNPGGLSASWNAGNTAVTISHSAFANATSYTVTVTAANDADGNAFSGNNTAGFTTAALNAPTISSVYNKTDPTKTQNWVHVTHYIPNYQGAVDETLNLIIEGTNFRELAVNGSSEAPAGVSLAVQPFGFSAFQAIADDPAIYWWQNVKIEAGIPDVLNTTAVVAGAAKVQISTADGAIEADVVIRPKVYGPTPASAPVGTKIAITGTAFDTNPANISVSFNGASATPSSATSTTLEVIVPAGALSGALSVSVNGAMSNANDNNGTPITFTVTQMSSPDADKISVTQNAPGAADQVVGAAGAVGAGATVRIFSDAALTNQISTATAAANGSFAAINIGDNQNGTVYIVQVNEGGNVSPSISKTNDIAGPTLSFSPAAGATGVAITQNIVVSFNEAVNTSSFVYSINPNPGNLSVSWNSPTNTIATISHNAFANSTSHTVTVTAATDAAGNAFSGNNTVSFTTAAPNAPTISSVYNKPDNTKTQKWVYVTHYVPNYQAAVDQTLNLIIEGSNFGEKAVNGSSEAPTGASLAVKPFGFADFQTIADDPAIYWWQNVKIENGIPDVLNNTAVVAGAATLRITTAGGATEESFAIKPKLYGVSPASAPVGSKITITGTAFDTNPANISVSFNGASAAPASATSTTLEVIVPAGAMSGALSVTVNNIISNANYNDGTPITFIVTVNNAPVASAGAATTTKNTAVAITLAATDADSNPLTYSIVANPTNGTLSPVSANIVTYTPNNNYTGSDSFTFKANDGLLDSNIATVSITVNDIIVPPTPAPTISSVYNKADNTKTQKSVYVTHYTPNYQGAVDQTLNLVIEGSNFGELVTNGSSEVPAGSSLAVKPFGFADFQTIADDPAIYWWQNVKIENGIPDVLNNTAVVAGAATLRITTAGGLTEESFAIKPKLYGINPASATTGATIKIDGTAFGTNIDNISVNFGSVSVKPTKADSTTLEVVVPANATTGVLTVMVNGQSETFGNFVVVDSPTASVEPASLAFSAIANSGNPTAQSLSVKNVGQGTLTWNISNTGNWLTVSPTTGETVAGNSSTVTAAVNISGLAAGTYNATITVASNGGNLEIPVTLTINAPSLDVPVILNISPTAAPAGVMFQLSGAKFGAQQSLSVVNFINKQTGTAYPAEIRSWSDATIEAIVPRLALAGSYDLKVIRQIVAAGSITALESDPAAFQITAAGVVETATTYPNPFNPPTQPVMIAYNPGTAANVGVYIYDMTAQLVYKQVTSASQITWDGIDTNNLTIGDGVYLIRVINEDTKTLLAKGKLLVVKR